MLLHNAAAYFKYKLYVLPELEHQLIHEVLAAPCRMWHKQLRMPLYIVSPCTDSTFECHAGTA